MLLVARYCMLLPMFNVTNVSKKRSPITVNFAQEIKESILGKKYNLSLVYVNNRESKKLNKEYRSKDKPTNVLSFPISDTEGEIFINLETKKQEAGKFEMSFKKYIGYLVIHGALHLKGLDHGDEMDKLEDKFLKKFF